ncbi:hypothetical protein RB600_009787 [Gaeumannomyces tritici]
MAAMQGTTTTTATSGSSNIELATREQLAEAPILKEEVAAAPVTNGVPQDSQPDQLQTTHGYSSFPVIAPNVHTNQSDAHIHPDLRSPARYMATANMMPAVAPQPAAGAPAPMSGHPISPPQAPGAQQLLPGPPTPEFGELTPDARKAKRELSQSKRAAQNRAAQRAFRQRKEGYIKKLEQQVRDYTEMDNSLKTLQSENYHLREYVMQLQTRLLNTQGEYPQPPPGLSLGHPHGGAPAMQSPGPLPAPQMTAPPACQEPVAPVPGAGTPLEQVAQAVANLGRAEHNAADSSATSPFVDKAFKPIPMDEDARTADEITRQLHDGLPATDM